MKKLLKIGLILFLIGIVAAVGTYLYVFHKPHRNIAREKPAYIVDAKQLYSDFSEDETTSYEKYGNKVLEVTGKVVEFEISDNSASLVYLDPFEGINCAFDSTTVIKEKNELSSIDVGNVVTLKGQCDGFDMIMGVVLTRCVLIKNNQFISSLD
jgi:hypothetical protein